MNEHDFAAAEQYLQHAIDHLSAREQKKLLRTIGQGLASRNRQRMTAQHDPLGAPWEARKKQNPREDDRPAQHGRGHRKRPQQGNPPLRFRYHGRTIRLKNYRRHGQRRVVGFDPASGKVKSFIVGEKISKAKGKKMMRGLKKRTHLRIRTLEAESRIGFFQANDARIARIHQYGKSQQLRCGKAHYPARVLIGLTPDDIDFVKETIYHAIIRGNGATPMKSYPPREHERRTHNQTVIATVREIDWQKKRFRAQRGDITTNWLPFPAVITANYRHWLPLREDMQILLNAPSGDLNLATVSGVLWRSAIDAPIDDVPPDERRHLDRILFDDGTLVEYHSQQKRLTVNTVGEINIHAQGEIRINSDSAIRLNAPMIYLN